MPFLVRFRNVLLLAMLSLIAGVLGLFFFGRSGMTPEGRKIDDSETQLAGEEGVTSRSKDFDYTQYEAGQPIFRVKAATQSMGKDDSSRLEGVEIQLFRTAGEPYRARSERALYQRRESAAELDGNVRLEGGNGLKLWTEKLVVGKEGQRISSPGPVRFEYGPSLTGEANHLRMEVPAQLVILQGGVRLRGREGGDNFLLVADRGYFEEQQRLLRAEGAVRLTHDGDFLAAQRLSAYLEENRDVLRFVRAKWKVSGRMRLQAQGSGSSAEPLDFASEGASLLLDPTGQQVRKIELEGSERMSAELRVPDSAAKTVRRLTSNYIVGDFTDDGLGTLQAFGQVHLAELPSGKGKIAERTPLRSVRSERAEATLDRQGSLDLMTMTGTVSFQEPGLEVTSRRARLNSKEGLAQFLGAPARMVSQEGEVTAEQLVYNRQRNHLVAAGKVRVALPMNGGIPGPLMRTGEGPVRVEAQEARWNREADRTVFTGNVRAWRGRDLLLAQEMIVQRQAGRLEASGGVRTIWHPPAPKAGEGAPSAFQSDTLEVSAEEFSYLGDEALLHYRGKVEVLDGPRTLRCGRTEIYLDDKERIRRLECLDSANLKDRSQGQEIEGDRAVHDPASGEIRVWGNPVKLRDRRGSQLQGELVIYHLASGTVEFGRVPKEGSGTP